MTTVSQLQFRYNPEEDRVLFRVNTMAGEEFRFWLTRRYSLLLARALQDHRSADPDVSAQNSGVARQAVQEFKQGEAMSQGDFQQQFKASESFPLGTAPRLAFKLTYRIDGDLLHLSITPREGKGINLALNQQLNFSVTRLLENAINKAQWGIPIASVDEVIPEDRVVN